MFRTAIYCGTFRRLYSVLVCFLLLNGCGGKDYEIAPVSGRVTLDNRPLANAHVGFQPTRSGNPTPGPGSFGNTDADGRFKLQTIGAREDGAVVGLHVVRIIMGRSEGEVSDRVLPRNTTLPPQADDGSLRFEVPSGGTEQADFQITSRGILR